MKRKQILAAAMLLSSAPAIGQQAIYVTGNPLPKGSDPNQIVCERQEKTGTRLGGRKVCLTALQWQEKRDEHRQTVEKFQQMNTSVGCPNGQVDC